MCVWVVCLERLNHGALIIHSPLRLNDDIIRVPVCKGEPSTAAVQLQRVQHLHQHSPLTLKRLGTRYSMCALLHQPADECGRIHNPKGSYAYMMTSRSGHQI